MKLLFQITIISFFSIFSHALTVIDVRTLDEWNTGHLESAINIEWQNITSIESNIPKNEKIYLYCRSGNRSGKATKILLDAGYTNVINAGSITEASALLDINIRN
jgi:phage shock protein E|tara:strand:- start:1618 stop:1932 length:315 start_codon:yes stop_codon:yes gene_type:complete